MQTLKSKIEEIIPITDYYEMQRTEDNFDINFDVYEEFTFEIARKIAEVLKSDDIILSSGSHPSNCDSCDFGAEYWISVHIKNVNLKNLLIESEENNVNK